MKLYECVGTKPDSLLGLAILWRGYVFGKLVKNLGDKLRMPSRFTYIYGVN